MAGLAADLERLPVGPKALAQRWLEVEHELGCLEAGFEHDPERRHLGQTVCWQRGVWSDTQEHESPQMLETYRVYDAHFKIMRMDQMSWCELAHQTVSTLRQTALDLPETLLGREHQRVLATAFKTMLEQLFPDPKKAPAEQASALEPLDPVQGRWRNGHHLFGLCCCFGRESLHQAVEGVAREDLPATCAALEQAAAYLTASTAAMVYTTDFSVKNYREEIRTAMPPGFSGSQNADFNHFKQLKGTVQVAVMRRWGQSPAQWPGELVAALRHFREADLLDLDQHVLIAAANIGFGLSLKQAQERLNDANAIAALRHIGETRRKEFRLD